MTKAVALILFLLFFGFAEAKADCVIDDDMPTTEQLKKSFKEGEAYEKAGKIEEAYKAYNIAQTQICFENPVRDEAMKRIAPIALKLGTKAEKDGEAEKAYGIYEAGRHYAAADRMMLKIARANPEDKGIVERGLNHFRMRAYRELEKGKRQDSNPAGGYKLDMGMHNEMMSIPVSNGKKALDAESLVLTEEYLSEYQALQNSRPQLPTLDPAVLKKLAGAERAFADKWQGDRISESLKALEKAASWFNMVQEEKELWALLKERYAKRASLIIERYYGAPEILGRADEYFRFRDDTNKKLDELRAKAKTLGDKAFEKGRYLDAREYYSIAYDKAGMNKAEAVIKKEEGKIAAQIKRMEDAAEKSEKEREKAAKDWEKKTIKDQKQRDKFLKEQEDLEKELGL